MPNFMTINSGIQVMLRLLPQQFDSFEVLVILIGQVYELPRWYGLRWHDVHTKLQGDRLKHSNNIKVSTSTI
jgi:hypothetical protein